ncbi:MAG: hypothetical protein ACOYL6_16545 [Bacteriovoracaceae bacterium]
MKFLFLLALILLPSQMLAQTIPNIDLVKGKKKIEVLIYNGKVVITDPTKEELTVSETEKEAKPEAKPLDKMAFKEKFKDFLKKEHRDEIRQKFKNFRKKTKYELKRLLAAIPSLIGYTFKAQELGAGLVITRRRITEVEIKTNVDVLNTMEIEDELYDWEEVYLRTNLSLMNNLFLDLGPGSLGLRNGAVTSVKVLRPRPLALDPATAKVKKILAQHLADFATVYKSVKLPTKALSFMEDYSVPGSELVYVSKGNLSLAFGLPVPIAVTPLSALGHFVVSYNGKLTKTIRNVGPDQDHPVFMITIENELSDSKEVSVDLRAGYQYDFTDISKKLSNFFSEKLESVVTSLPISNEQQNEAQDLTTTTQNMMGKSQFTLTFYGIGFYKKRFQNQQKIYIYDMSFPEAQVAFDLAMKNNFVQSDQLAATPGDNKTYLGVEQSSSVSSNNLEEGFWQTLGEQGIQQNNADDKKPINPSFSSSFRKGKKNGLLRFTLQSKKIKKQSSNSLAGLTEESEMLSKKKVLGFSGLFGLFGAGTDKEFIVRVNKRKVENNESQITVGMDYLLSKGKLKKNIQLSINQALFNVFTPEGQSVTSLSNQYLQKEKCFTKPRFQLSFDFDHSLIKELNQIPETELWEMLSTIILGQPLEPSSKMELLQVFQKNNPDISFEQAKKYHHYLKYMLDHNRIKQFKEDINEIDQAFQKQDTKALEKKFFKFKHKKILNVLIGQITGNRENLKLDSGEDIPVHIGLKLDSKECKLRWVFENFNDLTLVEDLNQTGTLNQLNLGNIN